MKTTVRIHICVVRASVIPIWQKRPILDLAVLKQIQCILYQRQQRGVSEGDVFVRLSSTAERRTQNAERWLQGVRQTFLSN